MRFVQAARTVKSNRSKIHATSQRTPFCLVFLLILLHILLTGCNETYSGTSPAATPSGNYSQAATVPARPANELAPDPKNPALPYVVVDTNQMGFYGDAGPILPPGPGEPFYGQDAHYKGVQPEYLDNHDGTVTDNNTGLMWQQTPAGMLTWREAAQYAENLSLAGYTDWRVPAIKELYSLADFNGNQHTSTPYINTEFFDFHYPDTSQGYRIMDAQYWSSNKYAGTTMNGDISAFGFNFADGRIKSYPIGEGLGPDKAAFIRCVRGNPVYGTNDFADNGDGTVSDRATGLMWTQADSGAAMNWEQALAYAESLNFGGYDDWRLPDAKEMQSIVDYTHAPDARDFEFAAPAIDPVFSLTRTESWFWTGTTHLETGGGVYVCFGQASAYNRRTGDFSINAHGAGAQRSDPKSGDPDNWPYGLGPQADEIRIYNYVRCVRGGPES